MSTQGNKLTAIADAIREKEGSTDPIVANDFPARIRAIQTGVDTSDATAAAGDIAEGKTAYVNEEKVTGTVETVLADETFERVAPTINVSGTGTNLNYVTGITKDVLLREDSILKLTKPISFFGDAEALNVVSGKTFTSSAGLRVQGTAPTQAAKTWTPATSDQNIPSGKFLTGAQTIKGDSNLVASNIKQGVTIFGITGTYAGKNSNIVTPPSSSALWKSVAYGKNKFVVINQSGNQAMYSEDGVNWIGTTLPYSQTWRKVHAYSGGFFAIGSSTNSNAAYSMDGITWSATTLPLQPTTNYADVGGNTTRLVMVRNGSNTADQKAIYSSDAINWTESNTSYYLKGRSYIAGAGNVFLALPSSNSGEAAFSNSGGKDWVKKAMNTTPFWGCITYANNKFVSLASKDTISTETSATCVVFSVSGTSLSSPTIVNLPFSAKWTSVCYGDKRFVAVADNSNQGAYSTDGYSWSAFDLQNSSSSTLKCNSIAYGNGVFVATIASSNSILVFNF